MHEKGAVSTIKVLHCSYDLTVKSREKLFLTAQKMKSIGISSQKQVVFH